MHVAVACMHGQRRVADLSGHHLGSSDLTLQTISDAYAHPHDRCPKPSPSKPPWVRQSLSCQDHQPSSLYPSGLRYSMLMPRLSAAQCLDSESPLALVPSEVIEASKRYKMMTAAFPGKLIIPVIGNCETFPDYHIGTSAHRYICESTSGYRSGSDVTAAGSVRRRPTAVWHLAVTAVRCVGSITAGGPASRPFPSGNNPPAVPCCAVPFRAVSCRVVPCRAVSCRARVRHVHNAQSGGCIHVTAWQHRPHIYMCEKKKDVF